MKLNLGCGGDIKQGYVNLDMRKAPGIDVVHNLNKVPYPFKDNEFDEIVAQNILEHLDSLIGTMEELQRILKPGGKLEIVVPHYNGSMAWGNPEHRRGFAHDSFLYFVRGFSGKEKYASRQFSSGKVRFIFSKRWQLWNWLVEAVANSFPHLYENTPLHVFPAMGLRIVLRK